MAGGPGCNKAEKGCHIFEIQIAELDSPNCEVNPNQTLIKIRIKGNGGGTLYNSKLEIYHIKGTQKNTYCELQWKDKTDPWKQGSIERDENLSSNTTYLFEAWVKKFGNPGIGLPFQLTISLDHGVPGHKSHKIDLDVKTG
jgi:hypothetical protein